MRIPRIVPAVLMVAAAGGMAWGCGSDNDGSSAADRANCFQNSNAYSYANLEGGSNPVSPKAYIQALGAHPKSAADPHPTTKSLNLTVKNGTATWKSTDGATACWISLYTKTSPSKNDWVKPNGSLKLDKNVYAVGIRGYVPLKPAVTGPGVGMQFSPADTKLCKKKANLRVVLDPKAIKALADVPAQRVHAGQKLTDSGPQTDALVATTDGDSVFWRARPNVYVCDVQATAGPDADHISSYFNDQSTSSGNTKPAPGYETMFQAIVVGYDPAQPVGPGARN
jgi:hypothetical protein